MVPDGWRCPSNMTIKWAGWPWKPDIPMYEMKMANTLNIVFRN
jgi:hypothetical protein